MDNIFFIIFYHVASLVKEVEAYACFSHQIVLFIFVPLEYHTFI